MPLGGIIPREGGPGVEPTPPTTGEQPTLIIEIDFAAEPTTGTRQWTDVTEWVRSASWQTSGRQHELQRTDAGTLTVLLDNNDARFDPTNTNSTYYPGVKRMRWIRARAYWQSAYYTRWTGLVESWSQEWPSAGHDATCVVRATDAFKILSLYDLGDLSFTETTTGGRIAEVLDVVGCGVGSIDAGQTTIPDDGPLSVGTKALSYIQDIAETENGLVFADQDGNIRFQDRHYRINETTSLVSIATIGDGATVGDTLVLEEDGVSQIRLEDNSGSLAPEEASAAVEEIPYATGQLDYDDSDVWPTVQVTPKDGTLETASNVISQSLHFDRVLSRTSMSDSQVEALAAAQWLSGIYADPAPRIPTVELQGRADSSWWTTILGITMSQRYTWIRRAAETISTDVHVERITETVDPYQGWRTSLQFSPATNSSYWLLETAGFGELDETATLAY